MDVKTCIETGDAGRLEELLGEDPSRANELIRWGTGVRSCLTHPLHFVSDMLFKGGLQASHTVPLADRLIKAGADLDFQKDGKGDTPLIGAASLGAEDLGIRLVEAGANLNLRGLFGETALHWAAFLGEDRLAARLIAGTTNLEVRDQQYKSTPLGWAVHGWCNPPAGNQGRQREVVVQLITAGALPGPELLESADVRNDPAILSALQRTQPKH